MKLVKYMKRRYGIWYQKRYQLIYAKKKERYGFWLVLLVALYALTQYISTKEIVSILAGKVRKAIDNSDSD
jgi:hypothetical protein